MTKASQRQIANDDYLVKNEPQLNLPFHHWQGIQR